MNTDSQPDTQTDTQPDTDGNTGTLTDTLTDRQRHRHTQRHTHTSIQEHEVMSLCRQHNCIQAAMSGVQPHLYSLQKKNELKK